LLLLLATLGRAAGEQVLHGHVPAVLKQLQPIGRLSATNELKLALGLPLRNGEMLRDLLRQIYDSASTNFHHYLTPLQFKHTFDPGQQDYQALGDFARRNGLAVIRTTPNRMLLDVSGSVAQIEATLHVTLRTYQHPSEPRTFYAPDAEPSIDLTNLVLYISGLDNYILPRPAGLKAVEADGSDCADFGTGSGPCGAFWGYDFRAAYAPGVSLSGAGQTIGLFQLDGYYANDIVTYEDRTGLPHVPLLNVLLPGANGSPGGHNSEVALDIEMAVSMAPGLSQVVVYEGANSLDILNEMAYPSQGEPLSYQLSTSWLYGDSPISDQIYTNFAAQGQSFLVASGDDGAYSGGVNGGPHSGPPADDPYITCVGGTVVTTTGPGGTWVSETTWRGSGGGISGIYPIQSWQQGINMSANQGSSTMRSIPDVAIIAYKVGSVWNNGTIGYTWGTSASAPLWAGFVALANQQAEQAGLRPLGFLNPRIYSIGLEAQYGSVFHDITTGNNTSTSSPTAFFAVTGYDLCTGWGTPKGINLINALNGSPSGFVWVDFANPAPGDGSYGNPYNTLVRGTNAVPFAGTIIIKGPGSSPEIMKIAKAMTIRAVGGPASIGR